MVVDTGAARSLINANFAHALRKESWDEKTRQHTFAPARIKALNPKRCLGVSNEPTAAIRVLQRLSISFRGFDSRGRARREIHDCDFSELPGCADVLLLGGPTCAQLHTTVFEDDEGRTKVEFGRMDITVNSELDVSTANMYMLK